MSESKCESVLITARIDTYYVFHAPSDREHGRCVKVECVNFSPCVPLCVLGVFDLYV